jgi:hypothetical protein
LPSDGHDLGWRAPAKVIGSLDVEVSHGGGEPRMNIELLERPIEPAALTCKGA